MATEEWKHQLEQRGEGLTGYLHLSSELLAFLPSCDRKRDVERELPRMVVTMATPTPSIQASICLAHRAGKDTLLLLKADGNLSSLAGQG